MEIESTFTEEAEDLLREATIEMADALRQAAIADSLRTRGQPVEVTASDVRRARNRLVWRSTPLKPFTDLALKVYAVLGVVIFVGAMFYPYAERILRESHTFRISFAIAVSGLLMTAVSILARFYLQTYHRIRGATRRED